MSSVAGALVTSIAVRVADQSRRAGDDAYSGPASSAGTTNLPSASDARAERRRRGAGDDHLGVGDGAAIRIGDSAAQARGARPATEITKNE